MKTSQMVAALCGAVLSLVGATAMAQAPTPAPAAAEPTATVNGAGKRMLQVIVPRNVKPNWEGDAGEYPNNPNPKKRGKTAPTFRCPPGTIPATVRSSDGVRSVYDQINRFDWASCEGAAPATGWNGDCAFVIRVTSTINSTAIWCATMEQAPPGQPATAFVTATEDGQPIHPPEPRCNDGMWNGQESDVDCGGPCSPCTAYKGCYIQDDCVSGLTCAWADRDTNRAVCTPPPPSIPPPSKVEQPYDFRPQFAFGAYVPVTGFFFTRGNGEQATDAGIALALGLNLNAPKMDITAILGGGLSRHSNRTDGAGLATAQLTATWKPKSAPWFGIGPGMGVQVDAAGGGIRNWSVGLGPAIKFSFACDRFAIIARLGIAIGGTADGAPPIPGISDLPGRRPALEVPGLDFSLGILAQLPGVCREKKEEK